MVSFVRVSVLLWADILAGYALWVMMTYLTDVWKINFTHAASIVNVFRGVAAILPIGMAFCVDTFMDDYRMLLLSSLAYSFGMCFLAMSTPHFLSGNCVEQKPADNCIGGTQKFLFYTSLVLIAVGISGHITSLASFLNLQLLGPNVTLCKRKPNNIILRWLDWIASIIIRICKRVIKCKYNPLVLPCQVFAAAFAVIFLPILGGFVLPYIKPWSVRFGIPAICTVTATLLFMSGSCSYDRTRRQEKLWGETERKKSVRTIPMWITFIMCGIVTSIGGTYFLEQANHMNRKIIGPLKVPLPILLIFYDYAKFYSTKLYVCVAKKLIPNGSRKYAPAIGIGVAILISILCCITASKVESRRLKSPLLLDKKGEITQISRMSMFWLLPQFLLLGAFDGISRYSIDSFFKDQVSDGDSEREKFPASVIRSCLIYTYGVLGLGFMGGVISSVLVPEAVLGVGYIAGVVSVYVVDKITGRGGAGEDKSWFQDTLNKSHLDKYYSTLAVLSCVNLVFFIFVAIWYSYQDPPMEDIQGANQAPESIRPFQEDDGGCCCCCLPRCCCGG